MSSIEVDGAKSPRKLFEKDTLTLKGKQFTSVVAGNTTTARSRSTRVAKPKTIDLTFTEGPGKGQTQKGIYELEGDTQKICFAKGDQERPTEFTSKPGSGQMIQVLEAREALNADEWSQG